MSHKKNKKLDQLLLDYEEMFNKPFPISAYLGVKDENVVIFEIQKCLDLKTPSTKKETYCID